MRIQSLWDRYKGEEIWIIGTGPSMRVFPHEIYREKITIGLNQAYRYGVPLTFSVTVHPELIIGNKDTPEHYFNYPHDVQTRWVVKKKPPMENLDFDNPRYYVFNTVQDDFSLIGKRVPDTLFVGRGVQQTAMHLAACMGAKTVVLVGVDMCALQALDAKGHLLNYQEHHGHAQHVRFHGWQPDDTYREYREYTAKARQVLFEALDITVLTLSPFLGLRNVDEDWARLHRERGLKPQPKAKDTSPYTRPMPGKAP